MACQAPRLAAADAIQLALCLLGRRLSLLEVPLGLLPAPPRLPLLGFGRTERLFSLLEPSSGGAVIRLRRGRSTPLPGCRLGVCEQGAEPGRLRLAHEPGGEQVACSVVVDRGGLEGGAHRFAGESDELSERLALGGRSGCEVPSAGELRVA